LLRDDGTQIGVVSLVEALSKGKELGVDAVEIAPLAVPPVVKLIDYKKFLYQLAKKQQAEKAVSVVFRKRLKSRQGYVSKESKRLAFDLLSEPFKNKLFDEKERLWRANRKKLALRRKFLEHKNSPFSERVLKKKK